MQPKLGKLEEGKPRKPTHTPVNPGKCDVSLAGEVAALQELARPDLDEAAMVKPASALRGKCRPAVAAPAQGKVSQAWI